MGVFDKFKDLVGIGEEFDDEDEYISEEEVEEAEKKLDRMENSRFSSGRAANKENNVVSMGALHAAGMNVVIMEPKVLDEAQELVDSLKENKPVIINLNSSSPENGRKIFDFLSGATYALKGGVQKIEDNIFIFAPKNINVYDRTDKGESEDGEIGFSDIDNFLGGK